MSSDLLELEQEKNDKIDLDMCRCGTCGWEGKVSECISELDSEGWEYESYRVDYCPKCDSEEVIEDYFPSEYEGMNSTQTLSLKLIDEMFENISDEEFLQTYLEGETFEGMTVNEYLDQR